MARAEHSGGDVLAEDRQRTLAPCAGLQRVAAGVRQHTQRVVVAPAGAGRVDDVRPAVAAQRLRRFEQRRDGLLPCVLRGRDRVALAHDRPGVAHGGDVEHLRKPARRFRPARPHEIERLAHFEDDAVDRPGVAPGGHPALEHIGSAGIVGQRLQRIHAVVRIDAVAGGEIDGPAPAHPLQFRRPELVAVGRRDGGPKHRRHLRRADVLQPARPCDADLGVADRTAIVVIAAVKNDRWVGGPGSRGRFDDRVGERCGECAAERRG